MIRYFPLLQAEKRKPQQRKKAQQDQHPVLGHFVADLKYKRVYVTSIEALMQAPLWERARTLRPVHAAEIFEAKKLEADKIEIQMIEAGEIEAKWETEKKVRMLTDRCVLCILPQVDLLACGTPAAFDDGLPRLTSSSVFFRLLCGRKVIPYGRGSSENILILF